MPLAPAIIDLEQLKDRVEVARLMAAKPSALKAGKFDRGELTLEVDRASLADVVEFLRDDADLRFDFLSDLTCVDLTPSEPRFEVIYHLLSIPRKTRLRLKVHLHGDDPNIESITPLWPSANYFEREVFDLFGVRFNGHPYLRRIMMPEDWEGHPLRKDYPVEGYR